MPALRILARIVAWSLAGIIVVLSVVPATLRPETSLPHGLEHFAIFWAAGLTFALGYSLTLMLATFLVIFSGAVEILQRPARAFERFHRRCICERHWTDNSFARRANTQP